MRSFWGLLLLILFSGCGSNAKTECQILLKIIGELQQQHVSATAQINATAFGDAIERLARERNTALPTDFRAQTPLEQCVAVSTAVKKKNDQFNLKESLVEALDVYVHTLDPHSRASTEKELASQSGFLTGFGFTCERNDTTGVVEITDVIAGSPAHVAGLLEGMVIESVNKQPTHAMSAVTLSRVLQDAKIGQVAIAIQGSREYVVLRNEYEAAPLKMDTFAYTKPVATIGYLKLRKLDGAVAFFAEALKAMRSSSALILDLRNLWGGPIDTAAELGDMLISGGDEPNFVGFLGRSLIPGSTLRLRNRGSLWDGPLVVLVNSSTKSSAEILAGALQDYGAVVVGTRTFGKGTRQSQRPLEEFGLPGALLLTDAFTVRPSGKVIQFQGVTPDVGMPIRRDHKYEADYERALPPPINQPPLAGYDPSLLPRRSKDFLEKLSGLQVRLTHQNEFTLDPELESAKEVALFLTRETTL